MALSDQSDDDDGIMMNGGGSRRKSSSFRTKKAEGLYSEENVKKRTSSDGCVKPVTAPKLLPDGTYARPSGRHRKGCDWDGVRGVWVPVENAGEQHDESMDDGGASPAKTEEEDEVDSEIVDEDEEEEEEEVEEEIEIKHPKKKNRKLNPDKDVVQLFAFDDPLKEITMDTGRGRPKRKLKAVARFDSQIFNTKQTSNCKAGEGFPCPRCSNVCSYDSRSCQECSLECYYEAGVGVVVLKERNVSVSPKKRSKTATPAKKASTAFNAGGGSTTKKKGNERTTSSRGSSAKKNERKAPQPEGKGNKERQSPKPRKKNARKAQKEPTGKEKEDQEEEEEEERPTAAVSKSTRETQPVDQREEKGDKQTNATHSASDGESSEKTQPIVREEEQLTKPVVGKEKDNAKEEAVGEKSDDDVSSAADSTNLGGEKTDAAAEEEEAGGDEHAIEEEEVPTVVMMDNSATNTGESTQPMLGGKEEAHHIENKTTSSARKKMEGVYSEENVKKRTSADGCVKPVTAPKLLPDGTYACPSGRQRKGCNWDGVRGVWVPSETYAQSVMYLAWLDFPPDFLETMAQFAGLKALAVGLGATKIGASKSMPDFHNKTQTMRGYFSFATLRYMPFVVPANIDFDAFDAEKAFHYIFHGQLLSGEWYNLSVDEKELIQNRLIGLGCLYSGPIDMEFTSRKSVAPRNDPKGYVYFASLDLDRHVSQAINSFIDDSNTPVQWSKIFDNLRAVKIGCSTLLQHGDEFFNEEEEDYDYDNKKEGISPRGGPYVWALSHIAPMKYSAV